MNIFLFLFSLTSWAQTISCDFFVVANVHFATVKLLYDGEGKLFPNAQVVNQLGMVREESIDADNPAPDESFHGWLSKGTKNELEMIIYKEPVGAPRSKLVNHAVPVGKVMWGRCQ